MSNVSSLFCRLLDKFCSINLNNRSWCRCLQEDFGTAFKIFFSYWHNTWKPTAEIPHCFSNLVQLPKIQYFNRSICEQNTHVIMDVLLVYFSGHKCGFIVVIDKVYLEQTSIKDAIPYNDTNLLYFYAEIKIFYKLWHKIVDMHFSKASSKRRNEVVVISRQ